MAAIVEAWRAGLLARENWGRNLAAGVVVGIVAVPLAMAFAIASGASPQQGLYTAIVAGLAVTLFGGSRVQVAGPTGAFAVLLARVTAHYGFAGLQIATILAGLMLLAFGLLKLGSVVRFIPESVVLGFTAGIGIVIWVGQWPSFFGIPAVQSESFAEKLLGMLRSLPSLDPATTAMGVASIVVIALWSKVPVAGKVPSPLVALVAATVVQAVFRFDTVATIGSTFGGIPRGLPSLQLPAFSLDLVRELARPAFAIALLGAIESLLSATVADGMIGARSDANQELVGQGIANVGSAAFGGFAATGAVARTATSVRNGGNSPLAGIVHAAVLALVLLVLAPLAYYVPLAALAAILFVVAFNMSQAGRIVRVVRRAPRSDAAVMLVTLGLTVFTDLVFAVEVGVALAIVNFLRRMTAAVDIREVGFEELEPHVVGDKTQAPVTLPEDVLVYSIEGPFFFGAVDQFEQALVHTHTMPRGVVIDLTRMPFIDLTGLAAMRDGIEALEKRGVLVALCGASGAVAARLERVEIAGSVDLPPTATMREAIVAIDHRRRKE